MKEYNAEDITDTTETPIITTEPVEFTSVVTVDDAEDAKENVAEETTAA